MQNHLILGNWNALCDVCGRKYKALDLRRRWDNLMVCEEDYELRHPQDFLRVQKEKINVEFVRPYPSQDTFIGNTCTLNDSQGIATTGVAGCARAGMVFPIGDFDSESLYIYEDRYVAIAGIAIAGLAKAGRVYSMQPDV